MDIIDVLLEDHAALRAELAALTGPFLRPREAGRAGRMALDNRGLLRDIRGFFNVFKTHEAVEDDFLSEAFCLVELEPEQRAAFTEGRRSLAETMKRFGSVAFSCDGERVQPMREISVRLRDDLEAHLRYEENVVFPKLRESLRKALLEDRGDRARASARRAVVRAGMGRMNGML